MKELLDAFNDFCTDPSIKSGKASSYTRAIKYLCNFLEINEINSQTIEEIKNSKNFISDTNSRLYKDLLQSLEVNGRASYLSNGFIKAALPQFLSFCGKNEKFNKTTKVQAIEKVIKTCGGSATWDDIYSKTELFYPNVKSSIEWKAGIRGVLYRELKNNRTFQRNNDGSFSLINNNIYNNENRQSDEDIDKISLKFLNNNINKEFDCDKLLGILPTSNSYKHKYNISNNNGTSIVSLNKVYSGRKAEKYFIDFLKYNKFEDNKDFYDVADDKNYGFDLNFHDIGIEIKNIKSGSFYLSDNEIAYLEKNKTFLVLVDIDNGIWALNKSSRWLENVISNIKEIRNYCSIKYPKLDLTDIKINIDDELESDCCEISHFGHDEILSILLSK